MHTPSILPKAIILQWAVRYRPQRIQPFTGQTLSSSLPASLQVICIPRVCPLRYRYPAYGTNYHQERVAAFGSPFERTPQWLSMITPRNTHCHGGGHSTIDAASHAKSRLCDCHPSACAPSRRGYCMHHSRRASTALVRLTDCAPLGP